MIMIMQSQNIYSLLTDMSVCREIVFAASRFCCKGDHLFECKEMESGVIDLMIVVYEFDQLWLEALPEARH